jgi:GDP-mannose 6-dehydrogenase
MVLQTRKKNVGILGMSFKSGTDDLRESPMVTLIETLIGKGIKLSIYDRDVELARLHGANKDYIEREIPHISSLMRPTLAEIVKTSEVIVVGKKEKEYKEALASLAGDVNVIDLVRLDGIEGLGGYDGICW